MLIYLFVGGVALILVGVILTYNTLVQKAQMASNGWSDIDVQLKRRSTLIPQLVRTVQGYAAHERDLFADVAEKRAKAMAAGISKAPGTEMRSCSTPAASRWATTPRTSSSARSL